MGKVEAYYPLKNSKEKDKFNNWPLTTMYRGGSGTF
jgi:hypothetical protein